MAKAVPLRENDKAVAWLVFCPGCQCGHMFYVDEAFARRHLHPRVRDNAHVKPPVWGFNGDAEHPTFKGSMLVNQHDPKRRCHSVVTNGKIRFLNDCFHGLRNQTVELPDYTD